MEKSGFGYKVFSLFVGLSGFQAYGFIFGVLFLCGLGLPMPEDITLIAAGFLAGKGNITLAGAMFVGFFGVLVGDGLLFLIGRQFGRAVFKWPGARRIFTQERITKAEKKIQSNAKLICFTARFTPGLRAPVYLTCGILKVKYSTFVVFDGVAALISVPVWVWLGFKFNAEIEKAFDVLASAKIYLIGFVLVVVGYLVIKSWWNKRKSKRTGETN